MNSIAIIISHFGLLPRYLDYFLQSCSYNKNITFFIFTDQVFDVYPIYTNVRFIPFSLAQFNALATRKIAKPVQVAKAYKLCDFKPAYGLIYEDYIESYDFWGFCDTDMVFGDTIKVLTPQLLAAHDVISAHPQYVSGPFTLFRNIPETKRLFLKSNDIDRVLTEQRTMKFCEASNAIQHLWEGYDLFDFPSEIESMTHLLKTPKKGDLRVLFSDMITERLQREITWENGLLFDDRKEIFIFHFIIYKTKTYFNISTWTNPRKFYFTKCGFFLNTIRSYTVCWAISILLNISYKSKRKITQWQKIGINYIR
ncbi:DUF6625 family protein [Hymenobacter sp. NBH84]|uniref:DUF6625 family protein n=1 Tax=Hymenobacter sp. NBH84 TaxID=2596915 RepID=UPI001629A0C6|nr:DUF6625 family protein [Hymenobacter sp. NBH84]